MNHNRALNAHVSRYPANSVMAAHHHPQPWLSLVVRGDYEERVGQQDQLCRAGDVLFHPAYESHQQRFGPAGVTQVLFAPDHDAIALLAASGLNMLTPTRIRSVGSSEVGMRLWRELEFSDAFSDLAIAGLALELVAAFGRDGAPGDRALPAWLRRARAFLDETAPEHYALDTLAREVGRHPVHVACEFRRFFGCTAGEHVRRVRLHRAAALLRETATPLAQVALDCGFGGSSELARAFRAGFGVTPSAYRRLSR